MGSCKHYLHNCHKSLIGQSKFKHHRKHFSTNKPVDGGRDMRGGVFLLTGFVRQKYDKSPGAPTVKVSH